MGNIARFAAINTKVRALEGRLLSKMDFQNLITKNSVEEVIAYLKDNTHYRSVLKDKNIHILRVDELELILKKHIVNQYKKLIPYFTNEYKKYFRILFMRYELEDLKLYLRAISRQEDISYVKDLIVYLGKYSKIDYALLSNSKNLEELIDNLKGTIYHDVLKPYLAEVPEKRLFYMEMRLDRLYFKLLSEQAERLENEDKKILKEGIGKNIDLLNLQWIYRGLRFYKLSPEELINYTLHNGYHLNFRKIKELCYSENEHQLIEKIIDSRYGFLLDNKETLEIYMERRIERYIYFLFLDYKSGENMNIIEASVFMHLLEYEMTDTISIVESIRYGIEKDKIKEFLIRRL